MTINDIRSAFDGQQPEEKSRPKAAFSRYVLQLWTADGNGVLHCLDAIDAGDRFRAFLFLADLAKPLSCTVPFSVSTLIAAASTDLSSTMRALICVVMVVSSI